MFGGKVRLNVKDSSPNHYLTIKQILSKFLLNVKDENYLKASNYLFSVTMSIFVKEYIISTLLYSLICIYFYYNEIMMKYNIVFDLNNINYYLLGLSLFFIIIELIVDKEQNIIFNSINETNEMFEEIESESNEMKVNNNLLWGGFILLDFLVVIFEIYCFLYMTKWLVTGFFLNNLISLYHNEVCDNWIVILMNFTLVGIILKTIIRIIKVKVIG